MQGMTTYDKSSANHNSASSSGVHPARVLLLGEGWESMDGALAAAADTGAVVGPSPPTTRLGATGAGATAAGPACC